MTHQLQHTEHSPDEIHTDGHEQLESHTNNQKNEQGL